MIEFGFHTVHFSPMFGATVPLMDVIHATAAAGFATLGVDLASIDAHGSLDTVAAALADHGLRCSDVLSDHGCRLAIEFVSYGGLTSIDHAIDLAGAIGWDRAAW